MVKGKISELGHESCNVQVVLEEYFSDASFQLRDESGEFLMVPSAGADHFYKGNDLYGEMNSGLSREKGNKVELLNQSVMDITRERDSLCEELEAIRQQLELKKARVKEL